MKTKKLICTFILLFSTVLIISPAVYAGNGTSVSQGEGNYPSVVSNEVFNQMYKSIIDQQEPIDIDSCKKASTKISKYLNPKTTASKTCLPIGEDCTYLTSNAGGGDVVIWSGTQSDGTYLQDWGDDQCWVGDILYNGWADAETTLYAAPFSGDVFEGAAWAWVGNAFYITGSELQISSPCRVSFYGDYYGSVTQLSNASASGVVFLGIYDFDDEEYIVLGDINQYAPSGNINHYADVTLKKGHTYAFTFIIWTEGHVADPIPGSIIGSEASSDYWSGALQGRGIDKYALSFNWYPY